MPRLTLKTSRTGKVAPAARKRTAHRAGLHEIETRYTFTPLKPGSLVWVTTEPKGWGMVARYYPGSPYYAVIVRGLPGYSIVTYKEVRSERMLTCEQQVGYFVEMFERGFERQD
jgi:hypothetical protein